MLMVSLIGWKVAGAAGTLVALLAICLPSSAVAYLLTRVWHRFRAAPWRRPVQIGVAPIAVGFVLASGIVLVRAADTTLAGYAVTAATVVLVLRTRIHPLVLMAAAAGLGIAGWL
jgi:chromate transporter